MNLYFNVLMTFVPLINLFVLYYSPHCQKLAPKFSRAAKLLRKVTPAIPLAIVNVAMEDGLRKKFNVRATPTMIWFQ